MDFNRLMKAKAKMADPVTIWILFLLVGWSYGSLGKIGLQILFYLTLGGFGIWTFIRLFTLQESIREYNKIIGLSEGLDKEEMFALGLY